MMLQPARIPAGFRRSVGSPRLPRRRRCACQAQPLPWRPAGPPTLGMRLTGASARVKSSGRHPGSAAAAANLAWQHALLLSGAQAPPWPLRSCSRTCCCHHCLVRHTWSRLLRRRSTERLCTSLNTPRTAGHARSPRMLSTVRRATVKATGRCPHPCAALASVRRRCSLGTAAGRGHAPAIVPVLNPPECDSADPPACLPATAHAVHFWLPSIEAGCVRISSVP